MANFHSVLLCILAHDVRSSPAQPIIFWFSFAILLLTVPACLAAVIILRAGFIAHNIPTPAFVKLSRPSSPHPSAALRPRS